MGMDENPLDEIYLVGAIYRHVQDRTGRVNHALAALVPFKATEATEADDAIREAVQAAMRDLAAENGASVEFEVGGFDLSEPQRILQWIQTMHDDYCTIQLGVFYGDPLQDPDVLSDPVTEAAFALGVTLKMEAQVSLPPAG
jgi:hypothetical protein